MSLIFSLNFLMSENQCLISNKIEDDNKIDDTM